MGKIILSFDDGRKDNYRVAKEILEPARLPATFNITTGYISKNISDKDKPGPHEPMSIKELQSLASNNLFEIAGHGYTHDNGLNNLVDGVIELRKLCNDSKIVGIASPHSQFELKNLDSAKVLLIENGIKYLRISNDYTKMNVWKRLVRKLNRMIKVPSIFYWVNIDSIMRKNNFLLYSVPILKDTSVKEVKYFVKHLIELGNDATCILMFHSILKNGENYYGDLFSWDYNDFRELCDFLFEERAEKKLYICKTADLFSENDVKIVDAIKK